MPTSGWTLTRSCSAVLAGESATTPVFPGPLITGNKVTIPLFLVQNMDYFWPLFAIGRYLPSQCRQPIDRLQHAPQHQHCKFFLKPLTNSCWQQDPSTGMVYSRLVVAGPMVLLASASAQSRPTIRSNINFRLPVRPVHSGTTRTIVRRFLYIILINKNLPQQHNTVMVWEVLW